MTVTKVLNQPLHVYGWIDGTDPGINPVAAGAWQEDGGVIFHLEI